MRFRDRAFSPYRMDVRATLEALASLSDESMALAVRSLDSETYASLKHAAYLDYRREHPEPTPIPPYALAIRQADRGRTVLSVSPQRLRELAALALTSLPENQGGRPSINSLDHLFACALVHHWVRINKTKPLLYSKNDGFADWAADMFKRIGAPRRDHTKILQGAIRQVIKRGRFSP